MKKIIILSCFIAFAFVILIPRSFIFAAEETENYETAIDKVADAYIGKSVPGACVIVSEHGEIVFSKAYGYADLEKIYLWILKTQFLNGDQYQKPLYG